MASNRVFLRVFVRLIGAIRPVSVAIGPPPIKGFTLVAVLRGVLVELLLFISSLPFRVCQLAD